MNEGQLYEQMKAGDEAAFNQLFQLYYEPLVKFAFKKTYDLPTSEDIVQSVFIAFWDNKSNWNIQTSVESYLRKIVHNRCIDFFRKESNVSRATALYFQQSDKMTIESPEETLLSEEQLKFIHSRIEALPLKCKAVFKLSRFEELSYLEIANQLGISKKTVEFHISTALRLLRQSLAISLFAAVLMR